MDIGTISFIKMSGRSWWRARYWDGKIVTEWDTFQLGNSKVSLSLPNVLGTAAGKTSRWEEVNKKGLRGLQLLCPNGQGCGLETNEDYKLFQFKVGVAKVGGPNETWAHVIGVVDDPLGNCTCWAWQPLEQRVVNFKDNVFQFKFENLGPLGLDALGVKV